MSKVAFFGHISPNFFDDLFFRNLLNFLGTPKNFSASPNFFYPFRPENSFFRLYRLKKCFLAQKDLFFRPKKNFFRLFRPKNPFLDLLGLKISLNPLKTLREHLFNLQIDEKNNIFLDFIAKNCSNYDPLNGECL